MRLFFLPEGPGTRQGVPAAQLDGGALASLLMPGLRGGRVILLLVGPHLRLSGTAHPSGEGGKAVQLVPASFSPRGVGPLPGLVGSRGGCASASQAQGSLRGITVVLEGAPHQRLLPDTGLTIPIQGGGANTWPEGVTA